MITDGSARRPERMSEARAILVKWMSVTDANNDGHIRGGTVMKLCDEEAGPASAGRSCDASAVWPSASRSPPSGNTRNGALPGGSAARRGGGERR
jgi:hypothetical protein